MYLCLRIPFCKIDNFYLGLWVWILTVSWNGWNRIEKNENWRFDVVTFNLEEKAYTVDSRYLELQGTLWNTSRYP